MSFIQNSGDILNILMALSIFTFTIFVCWMLYYVVMSVKNIFEITKDVKENVKKIEELIEITKQKIKTTFSVISFLDDGAEKIKDIVQKYKKNKRKKVTVKTSKRNSKTTTKVKTRSKKK